MSSLAILPTEVLLRIMGHLPTQRDRLNLARCNVRMYTELYLEAYSHMELDPCCCAQRVERLVDFLLHNGYIAGKVKSLKLGRMWTCNKHPTAPVTTRSFDDILKHWIEKFGQSSTHGLQQWWMRDLRTVDEPSVWQALLVFLLPNITYLEWLGDEPGSSSIESLLYGASLHLKFLNLTTTRAFQSLREVFFKVPLHTGPRISRRTPRSNIAQLVPFFQTSSMRKIKVHGLIGACSRLVRPNSSPITHIELHEGRSDSGFRELIAPCANLKSFKYFYPDDMCGYSLAPHFCIKSLLDTISSKTHSLETLCLSYSQARDFDMSSNASIRTFKEFRVLKNLQLPMHTFLGLDDMENLALDDNTVDRVSACNFMPLARYLPPSLERLCVTQWWVVASDGNMINQLVNLVMSKHMFPHLVNIEIQRIRDGSSGVDFLCPAIDEDNKRLSDACMEMGVDLISRMIA